MERMESGDGTMIIISPTSKQLGSPIDGFILELKEPYNVRRQHDGVMSAWLTPQQILELAQGLIAQASKCLR